MNPAKILRYLPSTGKIIVVVRDPRDMYSQMQQGGWMFAPGNFEAYIKYQMAMFNRWIEQKQKVPKDKLMQIRFEDLVNKYDESVNRVFKFLNIEEKLHTKKKNYFNPKISRKNVGLWREKLSKEVSNKLAANLKSIFDAYGYE
jgi:hypothetical protein